MAERRPRRSGGRTTALAASLTPFHVGRSNDVGAEATSESADLAVAAPHMSTRFARSTLPPRAQICSSYSGRRRQ